VEGVGLGALVALIAWFLRASWRKWPDPIIDSGPQWYAIWRTSLGALPYHDFDWYYGPASLLFNGLLFKCFGPGMMVLAVANLLVYAAIVALAYLAFRAAWGPLGAFAALAVFISVFSFSMVNAVGNYNYVLPYSNEATHGILLVLLTAFAAARWCERPSCLGAILLGLCGGMAAVLKPEFMLACGVLGMAALAMRYMQRQPVKLSEYGCLAAGVVLPTLLFSLWFARKESFAAAIVDTCQAWWLLMFRRPGVVIEETGYMGTDNGWRNVWWELAAALSAVLIIGSIWAMGWFVNRPWPKLVRWSAAAAACFLACSVDMGGGFEIGPCFPGLIAVILVVAGARLIREWRSNGKIDRGRVLQLFLVLLSAALLVRMVLRARINHFGFIQAAFAGMVAAAFIVAEVPRWTGEGKWGRRVAMTGMFVLLILGCGKVVADSAKNHATQTQPVGDGADRFYAYNASLDETGATIYWCARQMQQVAPTNTLLVLPEGVMINYLSRHPRPMREFVSDEPAYVRQLSQAKPDYVIRIWGDQRDGGMRRFGDPGQPGEQIRAWLDDNYTVVNMKRGQSKWAIILRRKAAH
jgi:hypothetical protein